MFRNVRGRMPIVCLVMAAICCVAQADVLMNVNIIYGGDGYAGAAAEGQAGDFWNNYWGSATSEISLKDSTTADTSIKMQKTIVGPWHGAGSASSAPNKMMWGYASWGGSFYLSGLDTSKTYDLYLYSGANDTASTCKFTIDGVEKQGVNTSRNVSTFVENENYVFFSDLSCNAQGEISCSVSGGPFNGLQLVEVVPEPATMGLFAIGGIVVAIRRRKSLSA